MSAAEPLVPESLPLAAWDPRADDGGEPILLVHGFGHNRAVWSSLVESLPRCWRPIAVDLRGHGASPWSPEGHYALEHYASDLGHFADERGLAGLHVVAHSLGGNVATLFAASRPGSLRSLTLVDTGPVLAERGASHVLDEVEDALRAFPSIAAHRRVLGQMHPFADARLLDRLAEASLVRRLDGRFEPALDPGVLGGTGQPLDAESLERRLWEAYRSVDCPLLIARGARSSVLRPEVADRMLAERGDGAARLSVFEEAGHAVMIDAAEAFLRVLLDFIESVPER